MNDKGARLSPDLNLIAFAHFSRRRIYRGETFVSVVAQVGKRTCAYCLHICAGLSSSDP